MNKADKISTVVVLILIAVGLIWGVLGVTIVMLALAVSFLVWALLN